MVIKTAEEIKAILAKNTYHRAEEDDPTELVEDDQAKKTAPKKSLFVPSQRAITQYHESNIELEALGVKVYPLDYEKDGHKVYPPAFENVDAPRVTVIDSVPYCFNDCRTGKDGAPRQFESRISEQVFMITQNLMTQVTYAKDPKSDDYAPKGEIPSHFLELEPFCTGFAKACVHPHREDGEDEESYRARIAEWAKILWYQIGGRSFATCKPYLDGIVRDKDTKECHSTADDDSRYLDNIRDIRFTVAKELGEINGRRHLQIFISLAYVNGGYNVLPNEKDLEKNEVTGKLYTVDVSGFTKFCQQAWSDEICSRSASNPGVSYPDPEQPPAMNFFVETTRGIATDYFNYIGNHPDEKGRMKKMNLLQPSKRNATPAGDTPAVGSKRKYPEPKRQATEAAVEAAAAPNE